MTGTRLSETGYSWKNGDCTTEVRRVSHGDLLIGQKRKNSSCGFDYYDESWVRAPLVLLKYVDEIGADIREINNWEKLMIKCGWEEPKKTYDYMRAHEWEYESHNYIDKDYRRYFTDCVISRVASNSERIEFDRFPHFDQQIMPNSPRVFPLIGEKDDLIFIVNHVRTGDVPIEVTINGRAEKYKICVKIPKEDAGRLFRGIVYFTNSFGSGGSGRMYPLSNILMDWEAVRKG